MNNFYDSFLCERQVDESFSWYDYELAFGNEDEPIPEEYDDYMRSFYAVV